MDDPDPATVRGRPDRDRRPPYRHPDGTVCVWRPYFTGNPKTGEWRHGWWFLGVGGWRWCGQQHPAE